MNIVIREATSDDISAVLGLYAQPGLDDGKVLSVEEAQLIWQSFASYPNYRLFVACETSNRSETAQSGTVVGSYALLVMHNLAHRGTPSAIAEDVVVDPHRQGLGIGRLMMAHAINQARQAGCYKLALSSNKKRHAAHAFYESLGFSQHGLSFVIETS